MRNTNSPTHSDRPKIVIDGVIFQLQPSGHGGISRVWHSLIPELVKALPGYDFLLLKRRGSEPGITSLPVREIPPYLNGSLSAMDADDEMLGRICAAEGAVLFISTYYTRAQGIHSLVFAHDMIPEVMGLNLDQPEWQGKRRAFATASSFVSVSESTKRDILARYALEATSVQVAHLGVAPHFTPADDAQVTAFRERHGLNTPFFLLVGRRGGYKNGAAALAGLSRMPEHLPATVVAVGGEGQLLPGESGLRLLGAMDDAELRIAYSAASALVYPSRYEGFGLPVAEAMACGCPVITTALSSLPEVGGDACLYIDPDAPTQLAEAMAQTLDPNTRERLQQAGLAQAAKFRWGTTAATIAAHLEHLIGEGLAMATAPRLNARGEHCYTNGDLIGAEAAFKRALELDAACADAHNNLGVLYWQLGKAQEAAAHLKRATELAPDHEEAALNYREVTGELERSSEELPVHFFTIVLNGNPFIRYHLDVFKQLPFKWHWHVVEGVAAQRHDSAWMLKYGGKVTDGLHRQGLSHDGTTEYLDELLEAYPDQITVYRKADGAFWDGKLEMVNAPLEEIQEECLLWQIDADELWTPEQLTQARSLFLNDPAKTAAYYWCWFFVGEHLLVSTRNCYSQNPAYEWLRTWRYLPGDRWASHSPPVLSRSGPHGASRDVAAIAPLRHAETERNGLVFQHFAYTTEQQLAFKETYYGYAGALARWSLLQRQTHFPLLLREHFPWVQDGTQVDLASRLGVTPLAVRDARTGHWSFSQSPSPFRPGLDPLPLDGRRKACFFHHPAWDADAWQEVIHAYARAFREADDVTLALWLDPSQGVSEEEAGAKILAALNRAGLSPDESPDILLISDDLDTQDVARLYAAADVIVPNGDLVQTERAQSVGSRVLSELTPEAWRKAIQPARASVQDSEADVIRRFITPGQTVFDVGANVGHWTEAVLAAHPDTHVHAFEPLPQVHAQLMRRLADYIKADRLVPQHLAIGLEEGVRTFYHYEASPTWSTFHRRHGVERQLGMAPPKPLPVFATTLDQYCARWNIPRIHFLKVDTEGGELDVLSGAQDLLAQGRIDYLQFEYGGTYRDAGITLVQVVELLHRHRYTIFKLTPQGLRHQPSITAADEDYEYANFLAVNERLRGSLLGERPQMLDLAQECAKHGITPRGVLHVGAHEGKEAKQYAAMGVERVLFIEANPAVFARLQENLKPFPQMQAVNCAASNENGQVQLHVTSMDQSSSILPLKHHQALYPEIHETHRVTVEAKTLDSLLEEQQLDPAGFNLLNLDIQGAELLALQGASELLRHIEAINTEVNFDELYEGCALIEHLDAFLGTHGFQRVATITPYHPTWGDALYVKRPVITMSTLGTNGRFANQLFQYAFLKTYAKDHDLAVQTPPWAGQLLFGHADPQLTRSLPQVKERSNRLAEALIPNASAPLKNVDVWGYFQYHTRYYAKHQAYIRSLFQPLPELAQRMQPAIDRLRALGKTVVGLHLRRGDYGYQHFFVAPNQWYLDWLAGFWETLEDPVLFIASDEPEKVLADFAAYRPVTIRDLGVDLGEANFYLDFHLLSQCDWTAISNSSFSFFAAMLNTNGKGFFRPHLPSQKLLPFDPWNSEPLFRDSLEPVTSTVASVPAAPTEYLVTAIVSTCNSERFIRGCLEDLEAQTIADRLEIIVIDSASDQNERAIVEEFQKRYDNIKYIRTAARETVYEAWNRGVRAASGRYLTNANTDDRHRRDAFERMVAEFERRPEVALVYADVQITEQENETFERCTPIGSYRWLDWSRRDLLERGCFMGPQPMWRRDVHDEYGEFDGNLVTSGDYEFWLRISQTNAFYHLPEFLGLYLKSPTSVEHRNRERQAVENRDILATYRQAAEQGTLVRRHYTDDPAHLMRHTRQAEALYEQGDVLAATTILEQVVAHNPRLATPLNNLGVISHQLGLQDRAIAYFEQAVAADPEHAEARENLAQCRGIPS
ncbi:FkbM family methyltransferase [bacterium]|nr:FkbM family methyltransferase [bacterium]